MKHAAIVPRADHPGSDRHEVARERRSRASWRRAAGEGPVEWNAWGDEAFELAKRENKPVLLSIGYSTCHWCHVMERESFEDEEIVVNEHFVPIKVDREERPFLPNRIVVVTSEGEHLCKTALVVPLVEGKRALGGRTTAYVCEKGRCELPTSDPDVFVRAAARQGAAAPGERRLAPAPGRLTVRWLSMRPRSSWSRSSSPRLVDEPRLPSARGDVAAGRGRPCARSTRHVARTTHQGRPKERTESSPEA